MGSTSCPCVSLSGQACANRRIIEKTSRSARSAARSPSPRHAAERVEAPAGDRASATVFGEPEGEGPACRGEPRHRQQPVIKQAADEVSPAKRRPLPRGGRASTPPTVDDPTESLHKPVENPLFAEKSLKGEGGASTL